MRTRHEVGTAVTVTAHDVELFRYTYRPDTPAFECPAPYFHPLRTLAGEVVFPADGLCRNPLEGRCIRAKFVRSSV